jgi:hypothetical protein
VASFAIRLVWGQNNILLRQGSLRNRQSKGLTPAYARCDLHGNPITIEFSAINWPAGVTSVHSRERYSFSVEIFLEVRAPASDRDLGKVSQRVRRITVYRDGNKMPAQIGPDWVHGLAGFGITVADAARDYSPGGALFVAQRRDSDRGKRDGPAADLPMRKPAPEQNLPCFQIFYAYTGKVLCSQG